MRRRFAPSSGALIAVGVVVAVAGALFLSGRGSPGGGVGLGRPAPPFTLESTDGSEVSLGDFRGRNVLLYFNEGAGCDACFYQTAVLVRSQALRASGVTLIPIVMNPLGQVSEELARFGITTPYLVDADGSVSKAYGMLGTGMHANLPGHGFVFVDGSGRIRWQKEYP